MLERLLTLQNNVQTYVCFLLSLRIFSIIFSKIDSNQEVLTIAAKFCSCFTPNTRIERPRLTKLEEDLWEQRWICMVSSKNIFLLHSELYLVSYLFHTSAKLLVLIWRVSSKNQICQKIPNLIYIWFVDIFEFIHIIFIIHNSTNFSTSSVNVDVVLNWNIDVSVHPPSCSHYCMT